MLQAAHESTNHADNHEDKEADNVADLRIRQLSNDLPTSENQDGHRHELLQRLGNVDEVARRTAVDPEEGVAITQYGISGGVEAQVYVPQDPTTKSSCNAEDHV